MNQYRNFSFLMFTAIIAAAFLSAPAMVSAQVVHPIYCKDPTQIFTGIKYDDNGNPEIDLIVDPEFEQKVLRGERHIEGDIPVTPIYDLVVRVKPLINEYCLPQWDERGNFVKKVDPPQHFPYDAYFKLGNEILLFGGLDYFGHKDVDGSLWYEWKVKGWQNGVFISEKLERVIKAVQGNGSSLRIGVLLELANKSVETVENPISFSLCAPLSGGDPHKIITMRGKSSGVEARFMAESSDNIRRDGFEKIQPLKKYSLQSESPSGGSYFAHFADLAEHDDTGWITFFSKLFITANAKPRKISSCGSDGSQYFFVTGRIMSLAYAPYGTGIAFFGTNFGGIPAPLAIHEMGHSFAGLEDEYRSGFDVTLYYANCAPPGREPHWGSVERSKAVGGEGFYYGDKVSGCSTDSQYRPSPQSLMNHVSYEGGLDQFNVVSCGYLLQAIRRGTLSLRSFYKSDLVANWKECMKMDGVVKPLISVAAEPPARGQSALSLLASVFSLFAQANPVANEIVGLNFDSPYLSVETFAEDGSVSAEIFKSSGDGENISWQDVEATPESENSEVPNPVLGADPEREGWFGWLIDGAVSVIESSAKSLATFLDSGRRSGSAPNMPGTTLPQEGAVHPVYCKDPTQIFTGIKYADGGNPKIRLLAGTEPVSQISSSKGLSLEVVPVINEYCLPQWDNNGILVTKAEPPPTLPFKTFLIKGEVLNSKTIVIGPGTFSRKEFINDEWIYSWDIQSSDFSSKDLKGGDYNFIVEIEQKGGEKSYEKLQVSFESHELPDLGIYGDKLSRLQSSVDQAVALFQDKVDRKAAGRKGGEALVADKDSQALYLLKKMKTDLEAHPNGSLKKLGGQNRFFYRLKSLRAMMNEPAVSAVIKNADDLLGFSYIFPPSPGKPNLIFIPGADGEACSYCAIDLLSEERAKFNVIGYSFDPTIPASEMPDAFLRKFSSSELREQEHVMLAMSIGNTIINSAVLKSHFNRDDLFKNSRVVSVGFLAGGSAKLLGGTKPMYVMIGKVFPPLAEVLKMADPANPEQTNIARYISEINAATKDIFYIQANDDPHVNLESGDSAYHSNRDKIFREMEGRIQFVTPPEVFERNNSHINLLLAPEVRWKIDSFVNPVLPRRDSDTDLAVKRGILAAFASWWRNVFDDAGVRNMAQVSGSAGGDGGMAELIESLLPGVVPDECAWLSEVLADSMILDGENYVATADSVKEYLVSSAACVFEEIENSAKAEVSSLIGETSVSTPILILPDSDWLFVPDDADGDSDGPVISAINVGGTYPNLTFTWKTDSPATSVLEYEKASVYNLTGSYGSFLQSDELVTEHSIFVGSLEREAYYYRVRSTGDFAKESVSAQQLWVNPTAVALNMIPASTKSGATITLQATAGPFDQGGNTITVTDSSGGVVQNVDNAIPGTSGYLSFTLSPVSGTSGKMFVSVASLSGEDIPVAVRTVGSMANTPVTPPNAVAVPASSIGSNITLQASASPFDQGGNTITVTDSSGKVVQTVTGAAPGSNGYLSFVLAPSGNSAGPLVISVKSAAGTDIPVAVSSGKVSSGIVPCGIDGDNDGILEDDEKCKWEDVIKLVGNIIDLIIMVVSVAAALSFMYAGFLYLTSAGQQGPVDRAKGIFKKVLAGYIIILVAWIFVHAIELQFFSTDPNARPKSQLGN